MPVRVLVTGASGFIGTALVRRLLASGIEVRAASRGNALPHIAAATGSPPLEWWRPSPPDSLAAWREAVSGCDVVVHLAALAHQTGAAGTGRWAEFCRANVELTHTLARATLSSDVKRLVFLSSVAAMCARSAVVVDEYTPCDPQDDYGRSKFEGERALRSELEGSAVDWCVLRAPLVYGPGNPGNMARLLRLITTGFPLPFGAIRNRRSFLYVDNLVDALLTVVRHPADIAGTYLISDGSDFSTPELVSALAAACGQRVRLVGVPLVLLRRLGQLGDLAQRVLRIPGGFDSYSVDRLVGSLQVNSARFRDVFSWDPPINVQDALVRTCGALHRNGDGPGDDFRGAARGA